ncbi:MAG: dTMP kinase [Betaproteobacteria bacterium]|nr:dTMP kinase [Betaproteobacteria bacterium]
MSGKFITLEGIDGAGKSSHLGDIAAYLAGRGVDVITTREPGGTPLAERLRDIVLNEPMDGNTEALLVFAARCEHLVKVIRPALARGAWVISDRFTDSTFAYQCGGRGLSEQRAATLEAWVHGDLQPALTLLFDAPVAVARERLNKGTPDPDKFEREQGEFFRNVRAAYLRRAEQFSDRIKIIDSARSLDVIRADIHVHLDRLLAHP